MDGFELNKIAASILLAGVIVMVVANITDAIYMPHGHHKERGFTIPITDQSAQASTNTTDAPPPVNIAELMKSADAARGGNDIRKCAVCHDFTKGGPNRVGPNLWNVVGGPKAHLKDYSYSQALASKGGTWTYEDLYHFLNSPRTFVPGTKMTFAGFSKPQDVADVIAYLRLQSDAPIALP